MSIRIVTFALVLVVTGAARAEQTGLECLASASSDYLRQKYALFQATPFGLTIPIATVLAKRRLVESFCLRSARCWSDDSSSFLFQGAFDSCVRDESGRD